jgi:hypothetical protein
VASRSDVASLITQFSLLALAYSEHSALQQI